MKTKSSLVKIILFSLSLMTLASCGPNSDSGDAVDTSVGQTLEQRVSAAIAAASDVPADNLSVSVQDGLVTISGSLDCEDCGGYRTPGQAGTVQQSLGAVVRAVPGVDEVRFDLEIPD